jgi:hypothetical protein
MHRRNRTFGRMGKVLALAGVATAVAGVGIASGARGVDAAGRRVFLPVPRGAVPAAAAVTSAQQRTAPVADSARVRQLLESARGANALVCELAARTVDGRTGWWSGSDALFAMSASGDSAARDVVTWMQHREVDVTTVPVLRSALADSDACVRRLAAPLLGRVRHASATDAMLATLGSADAGVRATAALALGFGEDVRGAGALEERLRQDSAPRVRATAAWALGEMERPESAQALIDALKDQEPLVRQSAARALGEIENAAAIPALTDLLKSDRDAGVRQAAAYALGEIIG